MTFLTSFSGSLTPHGERPQVRWAGPENLGQEECHPTRGMVGGRENKEVAASPVGPQGAMLTGGQEWPWSGGGAAAASEFPEE